MQYYQKIEHYCYGMPYIQDLAEVCLIKVEWVHGIVMSKRKRVFASP